MLRNRGDALMPGALDYRATRRGHHGRVWSQVPTLEPWVVTADDVDDRPGWTTLTPSETSCSPTNLDLSPNVGRGDVLSPVAPGGQQVREALDTDELVRRRRRRGGPARHAGGHRSPRRRVRAFRGRRDRRSIRRARYSARLSPRSTLRRRPCRAAARGERHRDRRRPAVEDGVGEAARWPGPIGSPAAGWHPRYDNDFYSIGVRAPQRTGSRHDPGGEKCQAFVDGAGGA